MPMYDRGGMVLKTGKIGRVNVLRQQLLLPGESIRPRVNGTVEMTGLRERESVRVHARMDAFVQPVRWLQESWPDYIKEGPSTSRTLPTHTVSAAPSMDDAPVASDFGIGGDTEMAIWTPFFDAPLRIYNEYWKWPEDPDATDWKRDGLKAVNLAHSWTRMQQFDGPMTGDTAMVTEAAAGGRERFDIRALAELQERYRQAIEADWMAHDRYIELLGELWGANGDREVDKVPLRLDGASVGVDPYNQYATDGPSQGQVMAFYNFGVGHHFGTVSMAEHAILTYVMCVRFSPVAEDEINPLVQVHGRSWADIVGEPGMLGQSRPEAVTGRDITGHAMLNQTIGYLPAGWRWRTRWNCIGTRVDERNSFPVLRSLTSIATEQQHRDPTRIGEVFATASLGDYKVNLDFDERSSSPIPGPLSSLYTGTDEEGRGSTYPYPSPRRVI